MIIMMRHTTRPSMASSSSSYMVAAITRTMIMTIVLMIMLMMQLDAVTATRVPLLGQLSKRSCDQSCHAIFGSSIGEVFACQLGCSAGDRIDVTSGTPYSNCSDYCVNDNTIGFSTWQSSTSTYITSGSSVGYALNYYVGTGDITVEQSVTSCLIGCHQRGLVRAPLDAHTCDQLCVMTASSYHWNNGDITACKLGCACGDALSLPSNNRTTCNQWCANHGSIVAAWPLYNNSDQLVMIYDNGMVNITNSTSLSLSSCSLACATRGICVVSSLVGINIWAINDQSSPLVTNSIVQPGFRISDDASVVYVASTTNMELQWIWSSSSSSLSNASSIGISTYQWLTFIMDESILTNVDLSIPNVGDVPLSSQSVNISFTCAAVGSTQVFIVIVITSSYGDMEYIMMRLTKACVPSSCDGLCVHGECQPDRRCHCDYGSNHGPYCDITWYMDKSVVCHGEPITLYWDYSQWRGDTLPSPVDWLNIVAPPLFSPHAYPTNAPYTDAEITTAAISQYAYQWSYLDGTSVSGTSIIVNGSLTYRVWESYSGLFSAAFLTNNLYVAKATADFVVLPWNHVSCLPSSLPPLCVKGTPQSDGSCLCASGFFGDLCQYGCAPLTIISGFGNDFSSSIDGSPYYKNAANCSWYIIPLLLRSDVYGASTSSSPSSSSGAATSANDIISVTGMTIIVEQLGLDNADSLRIFDGPLPNADKKLNALAGVQTSVLKLTYTNVTTALVTFSSFDTHNGNPANVGFKISWFSHGCPAGAIVQRLTANESWTCTACARGTWSSDVDSTLACMPCASNTYSSSIGSTSCNICDEGTFSNVNGATSCLRCDEHSFPSPCQPSTQLSTDQASVIWCIAVMIAIIFISCLIGVIRYSSSRVIFGASPPFLVLVVFGSLLLVTAASLNAAKQNAVICNSKNWLGHIGFQIVTGSMFAKNYRLHRIFNNPILRAVKIPNSQLFAAIGALALFDILLLSSWMATGAYHIPNPMRPICTSSARDTFWPLLIITKALFLVYGMYLTYAIRGVPSSFNESKFIAFSLLNVGCVAVIAMAVLYLGSVDPVVVVFVESFAIMYSVLVTVGLLIVPKIRAHLVSSGTATARLYTAIQRVRVGDRQSFMPSKQKTFGTHSPGGGGGGGVHTGGFSPMGGPSQMGDHEGAILRSFAMASSGAAGVSGGNNSSHIATGSNATPQFAAQDAPMNGTAMTLTTLTTATTTATNNNNGNGNGSILRVQYPGHSSSPSLPLTPVASACISSTDGAINGNGNDMTSSLPSPKSRSSESLIKATTTSSPPPTANSGGHRPNHGEPSSAATLVASSSSTAGIGTSLDNGATLRAPLQSSPSDGIRTITGITLHTLPSSASGATSNGITGYNNNNGAPLFVRSSSSAGAIMRHTPAVAASSSSASVAPAVIASSTLPVPSAAVNGLSSTSISHNMGHVTNPTGSLRGTPSTAAAGAAAANGNHGTSSALRQFRPAASATPARDDVSIRASGSIHHGATTAEQMMARIDQRLHLHELLTKQLGEAQERLTKCDEEITALQFEYEWLASKSPSSSTIGGAPTLSRASLTPSNRR